jgi:hypothetical protein
MSSVLEALIGKLRISFLRNVTNLSLFSKPCLQSTQLKWAPQYNWGILMFIKFDMIWLNLSPS